MTNIRTNLTHVTPTPDREHWAIVRPAAAPGPLLEIVKLAHSSRSFTDPGLLLDMQALCEPGEYPVFIAQAEAKVGWLIPVGSDPDEWVEVHQ